MELFLLLHGHSRSAALGKEERFQGTSAINDAAGTPVVLNTTGNANVCLPFVIALA